MEMVGGKYRRWEIGEKRRTFKGLLIFNLIL